MRFVSQIQKADDKEKFIKIIFIVESIKIRWKRFDYIFFFCNKKFAKNFHQLIIKNPRKIVLVKQSILFASLLIYFQTIEIDIDSFRESLKNPKKKLYSICSKTKRNYLPPF